MTRPYLDYYTKNNIIPVHQNIDDIEAHFNRRRFLYYTLGLHEFTFRHADILEVGPGTGDNALYIANIKPNSYSLLDGNPASIQALKDKQEKGLFNGPKEFNIIDTNFLDYQVKRKYDIVLAEGCLSGQLHPDIFLKHLSGFVRDGGFLVITTQTTTSLLAEICRRMFYPVLKIKYGNTDLSDKHILADLKKILYPHLKTLKGMNRDYTDWIQDNIIHPWGQSDSFAFSISQALQVLDNEFEIISTSPRFITDWRWYKSVTHKNSGINQRADSCHYNNTHMFLDYRYHSEQQPEHINGEYLTQLCKTAYDYHTSMHSDTHLDYLSEFLDCLNKIAGHIKLDMPETALSIEDYINLFPQFIKNSDAIDFKNFTGFFGRGLQFASFIKQ